MQSLLFLHPNFLPVILVTPSVSFLEYGVTFSPHLASRSGARTGRMEGGAMPAATSSSRTPFVLGRPGRWPERLDLRRNKEHVFGDFVLHAPVCERAGPSLWQCLLPLVWLFQFITVSLCMFLICHCIPCHCVCRCMLCHCVTACGVTVSLHAVSLCATDDPSAI